MREGKDNVRKQCDSGRWRAKNLYVSWLDGSGEFVMRVISDEVCEGLTERRRRLDM